MRKLSKETMNVASTPNVTVCSATAPSLRRSQWASARSPLQAVSTTSSAASINTRARDSFVYSRSIHARDGSRGFFTNSRGSLTSASAC